MITKEQLKGMPLWEAIAKYPENFKFRDGKKIGRVVEPVYNAERQALVQTPLPAKARKTGGTDSNCVAYSFKNPYWQSYPNNGMFYECNGEYKESDKDIILVEPLP